MRLSTIIRLPDGREGTICYRHLDGTGGVWGRHVFTLPLDGFGDEPPAPDFLLREKAYGPRARRYLPDVECVGGECSTVVGP